MDSPPDDCTATLGCLKRAAVPLKVAQPLTPELAYSKMAKYLFGEKLDVPEIHGTVFRTMAAVSRDIELVRIGSKKEQSGPLEATLLNEVDRHPSNHADQESNATGLAVQAVERPTKQYQTLLLLSGFFMTFHVIGINSVYGIFQVPPLPNKFTREVPSRSLLCFLC